MYLQICFQFNHLIALTDQNWRRRQRTARVFMQWCQTWRTWQCCWLFRQMIWRLSSFQVYGMDWRRHQRKPNGDPWKTVLQNETNCGGEFKEKHLVAYNSRFTKQSQSGMNDFMQNTKNPDINNVCSQKKYIVILLLSSQMASNCNRYWTHMNYIYYISDVGYKIC